MALLSIRNVPRRFGGIVAIDDVSLDVEQGQIVGLIGPNGAGKTTLFNVITRLYRPDAGELDFGGRAPLHPPPPRALALVRDAQARRARAGARRRPAAAPARRAGGRAEPRGGVGARRVHHAA